MGGAPAIPAGRMRADAAQPESLGPVHCPHFGPCGGCDLLDLPYAEELVRKEAAFRARITASPALRDATILPILAAAQPLFWRTALKLPYARQSGHLVCGFFQPRTHTIVDLDTCVVQHPQLLDLALATRELARRLRVPVYDEVAHTGVLRHLVARVGMGTGEILAGLVVREAGTPAVSKLAQALLERCAGLVGVVENVNTERTNVILGRRVLPLAGRPWLEERADGLTLRTSLGVFAQVNNAQASVLYAEVGRLLGDVRGRRIVDLYAGYGPIGLRLAHGGATVVAVEQSAAAVQEGSAAAQRNGLAASIRFVAATTETALAGIASEAVDAVVVDPPRRGLGAGVGAQLAAMRFPTLVYVSCNPATLVRDMESLSAAFVLRSVRLVDLFPRTKHVEAVALLQRTA